MADDPLGTVGFVDRRRCARPGCGDPADATLSFEYGSRAVWLHHLTDEPDPSAHDLCARHAERTVPPVGWQLDDRRVPATPIRPYFRAEAS